MSLLLQYGFCGNQALNLGTSVQPRVKPEKCEKMYFQILCFYFPDLSMTHTQLQTVQSMVSSRGSEEI